MTNVALHAQSKSAWNSKGRIPLFEWLRKDVSAEDTKRLKCLGNIVMPRCARLGLHVLLHELKNQSESP